MDAVSAESEKKEKMKTLYYFTWYLDGVISAVVLDDMLENHSLRTPIVVLSCDGELKPCWTNRAGRNSLCAQCRLYRDSTLRNLPRGARLIRISEYLDRASLDSIWDSQDFSYSNAAEIRGLKYKAVSIGHGALSSYVSWTRNQEPVVNADFRQFFDLLLKQQILLKETIDRVIDVERPDEIAIFNGRTADVRPVYETAIQRKIPLRVVESIRTGATEFRRVWFRNALPQNVRTRTEEIEKVWNDSNRTIQEKEEIAAQFFEGRRRGRLTRDVRVYIDKQRPGLLPEDWDPLRRNVVIFLSSEDEFAAVGDEFDRYKLFPSQESGIRRILEMTRGTNLKFYLRIHPNLANVGYGYHQRLYDLPRLFGNLVVIAPDSPVSSYALAEHADKIVVFGSTMGVEACYWGKPVVLLGGAYYYFLNVAHIPRSEEELFKLLVGSPTPCPRLGAQKYGYYLMDVFSYSVGIKYNPRIVRVFGRAVCTTLPHLRILGSDLLFKFYALIRFRLGAILFRLVAPEHTLSIPREGL